MKYRYYFKKPRSEITKDVFKWLAFSGAVCIAAASPYFSINLMKGVKRWREYKRRNIYNAFYNLKKQGCINIQKNNHQIYISLTDEGKKRAGWLQIDALKIQKPKKWDGMWRMVMFDIGRLKNIHREAFRGKLKELGFFPLQKSIWIHPFHCQDEIGLLRDFFGFSEKEMRLAVARDIGRDDWLKKVFKLQVYNH